MDNWEKLKAINGALAATLIPIALAFASNGYSTALKEREMQGRFVELAISILKEKPTPEAENLRGWAVSVLNTYSGVKMNAEATREVVKQVPLKEIIFDGSKLINIETLTQTCWKQNNIPATTLLIDFILKPEFSEKRVAVEKCMNDELNRKGVSQ